MKKETQITQILKNIKPRDLIYPGTLFVFFGIVALVFFFAIRFISQSINNAFSPEESGVSQALDLERYTLIAKKLNIPVSATQEDVAISAIPEMPPMTPETATTTEATTTPPIVATIDKRAITIAVKNSTSKKGLASTLAKALEDAGFQRPQTGNESGSYATTTLLLKESKRDYETLLLDVVRAIYPNAVTATSSSSASSDAIIIIGGK